MLRTFLHLACAILLLSGVMVTSAFSQSLSNSVQRTGVMGAGVLSTGGGGQAIQARSIAGTYRCGPDAKTCRWVGTTITVTQSGNTLEMKSDNGQTAHGELTSNVSMSVAGPWNMLGVIAADGHALEWSNGTKWTRE